MTKKTQTAYLDWRWDMEDSVNEFGERVESLEAVSRILEQIQLTGFDTVALQANVPIDLETGLISATAVETPHDRSLPDDTWLVVDQARSIGLDVKLALNIVDVNTDNTVSTYNVASTFDEKVFFDSVRSYETTLASIAEAHGVSQIQIGHFQNGFDTSNYLGDWEAIVESIRGVYSGELSYVSGYWGNAIWGLVDVVSVDFNPLLSREPIYDVETIVSKYFATEDYEQFGGSQDWNAVISGLVETYPTHSIELANISAWAGQNAIGPATDIWSDLLESGRYDGHAPDLPLQEAWITSFFEFLGNYLSDEVDGINVREYMPWIRSTWIWDEKNDSIWKDWAEISFELTSQPYAESVYATYLTQPWGTHRLHLGTDKFEEHVGFDWDDTFFFTAGGDQIYGGGGIDELRCEFQLSHSEVSIDSNSLTVAFRGDSVWLTGVERLAFSDTNLAIDLEGHAGQVAKLLGAVFGSESVGNAEYVGIGLGLLDGGMSYTDLAALAVSVTGYSSSTDVCNLLWENVIGSPATSTDIAPFKAMLDSGQLGIGQLTTLAADTSFNTHNIDLIGLSETGLYYI